ncbi:MAG: CRISPR-associated endonuclease Cas2 [Candidatus Competibacteraceae bacterium]|nr:CRISPR-associated endonuclease Cas2 [Candidatus Competibacteraceae bacterium]
MLIMVCYDISDDKRRQQLSTELENFGNRVQYSVFECHLNDAQFAELQERLLPLIDEAVDKLRYYPLCGKDVAAVLIDGKGTLSKDWDYFIV